MAESGPGCDDAASRRREKVLCIGNTCIDFINVAQEYPREDSDQSWVRNDFEKCGIETTHCLVKPVECPISTAVLSIATGSRTILYYPRDRPELTYSEFHEIFHGDFSNYSWLHFELGSTVEHISLMVDDVLAYSDKTVTISVEIEKPELKNAESVMCKADIVFMSKDYAKFKGYSSPSTAVEGLYKFCKAGAVLICAWGDVGAAARCCEITFMASALTDIKVIDSLGAGDTFVAGVISSLWTHGWTAEHDSHENSRNRFITNAIEFGCRLAGLKCTMFGYQGLKQFVSSVSNNCLIQLKPCLMQNPTPMAVLSAVSLIQARCPISVDNTCQHSMRVDEVIYSAMKTKSLLLLVFLLMGLSVIYCLYLKKAQGSNIECFVLF